jgi:hypothetical protein
VPVYQQFDPYLGRLVRGTLRRGNRGVLQRLKRRWILSHLRARRDAEPT